MLDKVVLLLGSVAERPCDDSHVDIRGCVDLADGITWKEHVQELGPMANLWAPSGHHRVQRFDAHVRRHPQAHVHWELCIALRRRHFT